MMAILIILFLCFSAAAQPIPLIQGSSAVPVVVNYGPCDYNSSCPLVNVTESTTPTTGDNKGYVKLATSFLAPASYQICEIDAYMNRSGNVSGMTMTAAMYSDDGNHGVGQMVGTGSLGVNCSALSTTYGYVRFTPIVANIVSGRRYWIVITFNTAGTSTGYVSWQNGISTTSTFDWNDGSSWVWSGTGSWNNRQGWFRLYGNTGTLGPPQIAQSWTNAGTSVSYLATNITASGCFPFIMLSRSYYSSSDATAYTPTFNGSTNNWSLLQRTKWSADGHGWLELWGDCIMSQHGTGSLSNAWSASVQSATIWVACVTNAIWFDPVAGAVAYKTNSDASITNSVTSALNERVFSASVVTNSTPTATIGAGQTLVGVVTPGAGTHIVYIATMQGNTNAVNPFFTWTVGATNGMAEASASPIGF